MKRILVIGCCGAGKSTLSRKLARITGLPLIHLDQEYWQPNWVESDPADWEAKVETLIQDDSWIIDGNYGGTMPKRLTRADTVVFLDRSRWVCLYRVLKRTSLHYGQARSELPEGCRERFDWEFLKYVYRFQLDRRPGILRNLEDLSPEKQVFHMKSDKEVTQFLHSLERQNESVGNG